MIEQCTTTVAAAMSASLFLNPSVDYAPIKQQGNIAVLTFQVSAGQNCNHFHSPQTGNELSIAPKRALFLEGIPTGHVVRFVFRQWRYLADISLVCWPEINCAPGHMRRLHDRTHGVEHPPAPRTAQRCTKILAKNLCQKHCTITPVEWHLFFLP